MSDGVPDGLVDDAAFDDLLPIDLQLRSSTHFTDLAVARRVAAWLAPAPGATVLDVGSGVGKFCLAAAHAAPHAHFTGVERRGHLVEFANSLVRRWRLPNVRFVHADAFELPWSDFDGLYLFNPFGEHVLGEPFALDETVALTRATYRASVGATRHRLEHARVGTRLATYHGFGATVPPGFTRDRDRDERGDRVELWLKTSE